HPRVTVQLLRNVRSDIARVPASASSKPTAGNSPPVSRKRARSPDMKPRHHSGGDLPSIEPSERDLVTRKNRNRLHILQAFGVVSAPSHVAKTELVLSLNCLFGGSYEESLICCAGVHNTGDFRLGASNNGTYRRHGHRFPRRSDSGRSGQSCQ